MFVEQNTSADINRSFVLQTCVFTQTTKTRKNIGMNPENVHKHCTSCQLTARQQLPQSATYSTSYSYVRYLFPDQPRTVGPTAFPSSVHILLRHIQTGELLAIKTLPTMFANEHAAINWCMFPEKWTACQSRRASEDGWRQRAMSWLVCTDRHWTFVVSCSGLSLVWNRGSNGLE